MDDMVPSGTMKTLLIVYQRLVSNFIARCKCLIQNRFGAGPRRRMRAVSRLGARAMDVSSYASDLNDAEWALLEPLIARRHPAGRRQTYPLRRIIDAIFYLLRTGAQWRMLPHEYPSRSAVFYHYAQWRQNGTWEQVTRRPARELSPHDWPGSSTERGDHRQSIGQDDRDGRAARL